MTDTDALPDDVSQLKALIVGQRAEIASQQAEIAHLQLWIAKRRRQQFGRRSERAGTLLDQLELHLEELETTATDRARVSRSRIISARPGLKVWRSHPAVPAIRNPRSCGRGITAFDPGRLGG